MPGWEKTPPQKRVQANGPLIVYYRNLRNYTQENLAIASGLSVRVVAKAEASNSVHTDTLAALAEALSIPQRPVYPEDLASDPKTLAARFFRAYAEHEQNVVAHCRDFLDDHMRVFVAGDPKIIPFAGTFSGPDGLDQFFKLLFANIKRVDKSSMSNPLLIAEGTNVVAVGEEIATTALVPTPSVVPIVIRMEFRRGKMVSFEDFFDNRLPSTVGGSIEVPPSPQGTDEK